MTTGPALRERRDALGVSRRALSQLTGVPASRIGRAELGTGREVPASDARTLVETLDRIARGEVEVPRWEGYVAPDGRVVIPPRVLPPLPQPRRWVPGGDPGEWEDPRYEALGRTHRLALAEARRIWNAAGGRVPETCGIPIRRGPWAGRDCPCPAGDKTDHRGYGPCWPHGGIKLRGRATGGWLMAHAYARELDVSPWDALLMAVRIAAGKVAYCQLVLARATDDLEIEGRITRGDDGLLLHPDTGQPLGVGTLRDLSFWNEKLELWHDRLTRCSKAAIDAGVAAWQVQRLETEAQAIAAVINNVIEGVQEDAPAEVVTRMRALARRELLRLDEEQRSLAAAGDADGPVVDSTWSES